MSTSDRGGAPPQVRDEADRLLLERVRIVVWIVLAALPIYVLADYYVQPPTISILQVEKLILCVICALIWRATRRDELRRFARVMGIVLVTAIVATSAASSILTGEYTTHAFLSVMVTLFGATLAPWGVATQLLAVLIVAVSVLWNVRVVTGSFAVLLDYSAVTVGLTWMASVYVAWILEDNRQKLARENAERARAEAALREEAATSTALARVGEELIAAVNSPALLDRLSQLTTQMVSGDCSWTMLHKASADTYVVAAHSGFSPEQSAEIDLVTIPRETILEFLARLEREEVILVNPGEPDLGAPARLAEQYGVTTRMHVGLRRGEELIGYHAAAYRRPGATFSNQQQRLMRGITNLASMALETARLVEELNRADRFKSDFVANMSHELRTPLHVIIGYHELLIDGAFGPLTPEQSDTLQRTDQRAHELLDLINATLDLSRMEATPVALEVRDLRIAEVFEELAHETRAMADRPELQWEWRVPPDLPPVRTDPVKLRMVLKNLLQNAIKFTPQGAVLVEARANGDGVELQVADTGVGIAKDAQEHIFEPFFQVDPTGRQPRGGAGLGLYIVRRLLDMLGGRISVESEVGRGSVFRVWIPFDVTAKAAKP